MNIFFAEFSHMATKCNQSEKYPLGWPKRLAGAGNIEFVISYTEVVFNSHSFH